jgi:hypothetical protein
MPWANIAKEGIALPGAIDQGLDASTAALRPATRGDHLRKFHQQLHGHPSPPIFGGEMQHRRQHFVGVRIRATIQRFNLVLGRFPTIPPNRKRSATKESRRPLVKRLVMESSKSAVCAAMRQGSLILPAASRTAECLMEAIVFRRGSISSRRCRPVAGESRQV